MTHSDEFLEALQQILSDNNIPTETVNRIAIAIALDAKHTVVKYKLETAAQLNKLQELIEAQTKNIDKLAVFTEKHENYMQTHPSLLYLFRFRTKETVLVIVMLFILLTILWSSDAREGLLSLLGL